MREGCIGNCLLCGKCGSFAILDAFQNTQTFESRKGYGIAVDIGTTSIVLALIDLEAGTVMARHSFMNPQRAFGPDVISRIDAANKGRLADMRRLVAESIVTGIGELLGSRGVHRIDDMTIAGNTVMTYLLLGLPCESLGAFPFKPAYQLEEHYDFSGVFGIDAYACPVRIVPWLAAFVGGDITAGLLNVLLQKKKRFLLIDLGTNGEMALYDNGKLTVTATAAGPAFEGSAHIGGASAVLSDLAELIRMSYVEETGLLHENAPSLFSQKEIRDLQLAKSAVRSGLEILLETAGLSYEALDTVYLAGGIGQAMDTDSAIAAGLLPGALKEKVRAVGNTSLGGAAHLLLEPKGAATDMAKLLTAAVEINLSNHPKFNDYFMEYMCF